MLDNTDVFEFLFEESNDAIVVTDTNNKIVDVNDSFCLITGRQREQVIGQSPSIMKSGLHDEAFYQCMWRDITEKGMWQGEIWDRKANGQLFLKWLKIKVIKDDKGRVTNYIGLFKSIPMIQQDAEKFIGVSGEQSQNESKQQYKPVFPGVITVKTDEEQFFFTRSMVVELLERCGLSPLRAHVTATIVLARLIECNVNDISLSKLYGIIHSLIGYQCGKRAAKRLNAWYRFRATNHPLIVIICGVTGTGKSTIAREIATYLNANCHSTDIMREAIRSLFPDHRTFSVLNTSSYEKNNRGFWDRIECGYEYRICGYRKKTEAIWPALEGALKRAIHERTSLIVEGVHTEPSFPFSLGEPKKGCVFPILLTVPNVDLLERRFEKREKKNPRRSSDKYKDNIQSILEIQAYLVERARRFDIPVVQNIHKTRTLRKVMGLVSDRLVDYYPDEPFACSREHEGIRRTFRDLDLQIDSDLKCRVDCDLQCGAD